MTVTDPYTDWERKQHDADNGRRAAFIGGLRKLAAILDAHPEVPLPYHGNGTSITFHFLEDEGAREALAAAARAFPVVWRKEVRGDDEYGHYFDLDAKLGGLSVQLTAYRDAVCQRVVTGTEDREVDEVVTPAVTRKVTKPVDVVEWVCGSVLAPATATAADEFAA